MINWKVNDATDFEKYEVEYSRQSDNFISIHSVQDDNAENYSFEHSIKNEGTLYYRLKIIHSDKSISYSKVVIINTGKHNIDIQKTYPNPFSNSISADIELASTEKIFIQLIDISGKNIKSEMTQGHPGINKVTLSELTKIHKGIYFIKVKAGDQIICKKVIKN